MNDDMSGIVWMFGMIGMAGVVCLLLATYQIWRGLSTNGWREVRGVIRANDFASHEDVPSLLRGHGMGNTPSYAFSVSYDYTVDGQTFAGTRIYYGMRNMNKKAKLLALLSEFEIGKEVPVFVDPATPVRSVLIPGVSSASVGLYILGLILTVVGIGVYSFIRS